MSIHDIQTACGLKISFSEYNPRLASTQTSPKPPYRNLLDLIGRTTTELFPVFQILTSVS